MNAEANTIVPPVNAESNTERLPGFRQVAVWRGTALPPEQVQEMVDWFKSDFGTRVQFLESIITGPDSNGPGGRPDVFIAVHEEDLMGFSVRRFSLGNDTPVWIEDIYGNGNGGCYPARVREYKTWDAGLVRSADDEEAA